ncbi:MAG: hypothetical protein M1820_004559 [Bogoriella megaspora]|nr:MAG: hypothetical protein M1820_004559 [Bogoriella megaspora]
MERPGQQRDMIEPDHDPRIEHRDHADDEDLDSLPGLDPIHGHYPWRDVPDPDEEDIDQFTGRPSRRPPGPNRMDEPPELEHPLMRNFATMLQGITGQPFEPTRGGDMRPGGTAPGTRIIREGPRVEIHREGPNASFHFSSFSMGPHTHVPDPFAELARPRYGHNFPQDPFLLTRGTSIYGHIFPEMHRNVPRPDHEDQVDGDRRPINPLQMLLTSLLGPPGGIHGDAVYSQEAFDRVMSQLMEQHSTGTAPGPASAEAIGALPQKKVDKAMLDDQGKAECSICMDEVTLDDTVRVLPCKHWFHPDCIEAWLKEHDTCPHCREGIMPKNPSSSQSGGVRSPDEPPLHAQYPWSPGARRASETQHYPWAGPNSPNASRRPHASSRRSSSGRSSGHTLHNSGGHDGGQDHGGGGRGIGGRMRSFFGGGSSSRGH